MSDSLPNTTAIIGQTAVFRSILGGIIVAYPSGRRDWAVAVRIDDQDLLWDCYLASVVFDSFNDDQTECRMTCLMRSFEAPCRVITAAVTIDQIEAACNELFAQEQPR